LQCKDQQQPVFLHQVLLGAEHVLLPAAAAAATVKQPPLTTEWKETKEPKVGSFGQYIEHFPKEAQLPACS